MLFKYGLRLVDGELLIVATTELPETAIAIYGHYEVHSEVYEAITREKRIKKWNRRWKINLIEQNNPQWLDLGIGLF